MDKVNDIEKVVQIIKENQYFLLISHLYPDGDSLGSQTALHNLLKTMHKESYMLCADCLPYQYEFLPSVGEIKEGLDAVKPGVIPVAFFLDCADENRIGVDIDEIFKKSKILINIDHHIKNTNFGDINIVDPYKAATSQIIYDIIINGFPEFLNLEIGTGIYTGILTDTGKFQYENTTSAIHKIISHLLEFGIKPAYIYSKIYENEPFNRFKLLERVFERINFIKEEGLIYSYVLQDDFIDLGLPFSAQDGIIELLRSTKGVRIAALIKQIDDQQSKVSLRSSDNRINVADLAVRFGGGGHRMAAAYSSTGKIDKITDELVLMVQNLEYE